MKLDKSSEYRLRLEDLSRQAWKKRLDEAARFYGPKADLRALARSAEPIDLQKLGERLSAEDEKRQPELRHLCRPHWQDGIPDAEIPSRDLLDDGLDALSVFEWAVEASYLDAATVMPLARAAILDLCWSDGVQSFVRNYEYDAVVQLAERCKIRFPVKAEKLPEIDQRLEVGFSAFASAFARLKQDTVIEAWTDLLDDFYYADIDGDPYQDRFERFAGYLEDENMALSRKARDVFEERLAGGVLFVDLLGRFLGGLDEHARGSYARAFRYWLARHHGFRQQDEPTFKLVDRPSWAERLQQAMSDTSRLQSVIAAHCDGEKARLFISERIEKDFAEKSSVLRAATLQLVREKVF